MRLLRKFAFACAALTALLAVLALALLPLLFVTGFLTWTIDENSTLPEGIEVTSDGLVSGSCHAVPPAVSQVHVAEAKSAVLVVPPRSRVKYLPSANTASIAFSALSAASFSPM